jgi:flagellar motor switch protein FliG
LKALAAAGGLTTVDERAKYDGVAFSASVLNEMPLEASDTVLDRISESARDVATKIREAMFTFEDLARVESRQLQPLMREIPSETLLVALHTASEALREHFLTAVSTRAAQTIRDDLAALPPKRLSEVEAAQREIVETTMRLATEGRIVLPDRGEGAR